VTAE